MAITTNGGAGVTADAVATLSNKTLEAPVINNATFTGAQAGLEIKFGNNIVLEGTTADAFETTVTAGDPTADRTITLPDATGQVVLRDTTDTLTNKTLTSPVISTIVNTGTLTLPTTTGTVALTSDITVTASSTTTLSNKTIALGSNTVSGTIAEFNTAVTDADLATLAGIETLSNKTITSPIITGATFNDASIVFEGATANAFETTLTVTDPTADRTITLPDATTTLVGTDTTDTLSNKTLTAPKFADLGFIADANGNELIILDTVTSAVNEVTLANAATGNAPTLTASGGDTNIGITLTPKGSGNVTATALVYTQTLNTPSFTTNAYTLVLGDQGDILLASNGSTAGTISIPTNANVAFPTGTQITIVQTGSGQITINAVTSGTTTVNSTGATATAPKLRAQYSSATCIKTATDTWLVIGDIS